MPRQLPPRLASVIATFAARADAQYTATPAGAINNCDVLARRFAATCRRAGLTADVLELNGCVGHYPDAHPRWRTRAARQVGHARSLAAYAIAHRVRHYVTAVRVSRVRRTWLIDWTFRQFLPESAWPLTTALPCALSTIVCGALHGLDDTPNRCAPLFLPLPADRRETPRGQARWLVRGRGQFSAADYLALHTARLRRRAA